MALGAKRAQRCDVIISRHWASPRIDYRRSATAKQIPVCKEHNEDCWVKSPRPDSLPRPPNRCS